MKAIDWKDIPVPDNKAIDAFLAIVEALAIPAIMPPDIEAALARALKDKSHNRRIRDRYYTKDKNYGSGDIA